MNDDALLESELLARFRSGQTMSHAEYDAAFRLDYADRGRQWAARVRAERAALLDAANRERDAMTEAGPYPRPDLCAAWLGFLSCLTSQEPFIELRGLDLRGLLIAGLGGGHYGFQGCDLRGAEIEDCTFWDADFRGADLRGCALTDCHFRAGALFQGADVRGALISHNQFPKPLGATFALVTGRDQATFAYNRAGQ